MTEKSIIAQARDWLTEDVPVATALGDVTKATMTGAALAPITIAGVATVGFGALIVGPFSLVVAPFAAYSAYKALTVKRKATSD